MSDKEALQKLETLIKFFNNYNKMLSDMEIEGGVEQEFLLAA